MILKKELEPREYQKTIAENASKENTLVVLPTGMGKTLISLLVAVNRLDKYPSKVMILSPTRPLSAQHQKTFEQFTHIPKEEIILLTGKIKPEDRTVLYKKAQVIIATPQTIENDLEKGRINLKDFSFLVFDEAHRGVKEYSYSYVARKYRMQAEHPLILALTASPGGTQEKIQDICDNLFIKQVEIRDENSVDVEKYIQQVEKENVYVELPEEFKKIKTLLEEVLNDDLYWLKEKHYTFTYKPTKGMLIALQNRVSASFTRGSKNYGAFWAILRVAGAIKLEHALGLLETQGIRFLYEFLQKLESSNKKTDTRIVKDPRFREAMKLTHDLYSKNIEHPKMQKTIDTIKDFLKEKPNAKIILFANFRNTVDRIHNLLVENGIGSEILIGQTMKEGKGLSQKQQIEVLERFKEGEFPVLLGTQIIEEGIDVPSIDYAIFYEPVASEIRMIQRRGRVGRQSIGKVIFMITKDTRDEAYYYASLRKESKMKGVVSSLQKKGVKKKKENLMDWV
ncbi:MAG: DEAD/DEAH box helicase [Candidatus Aenigmarchaeota archaeon]|nr:DEAD/DEAH box helicase [Candidatus Aenigmarchaeota archaeon]